MNTTFLTTQFLDRFVRKTVLVSTLCFISAAPAIHAAEATPAELLERGIYSEETKGDLDGAMRLYQQIVTEMKANQALAAQAQFRLAMCYDKKKDYAAATKAFETLIRDYPAQTELVALAHDYIADGNALLPVPWKSGEEMIFQMKFPSGVKIGMGRYTIEEDTLNGRKIWRLSSQLLAGMQQWSQVEVEADSFKPIHCLWRHTVIGEADTTYVLGGADVAIKGQSAARHIPVTGPIYDNEQAIQLMRRLPLAVGYSTDVSLLIGLGGGSVLPIKIDVSGKESVTVPAGTFECYKVTLSIGQTFWYATDPQRHLVKFEAGGVIAELSGVRQRIPGERLLVRDGLFGFSFQTLPNGLAQRTEKEGETAHSTYMLLDPAGVASMVLKLERRDRFEEKVRTSPRSFAEYKIEQGKKFTASFKIRPDSWRDIIIAGQPAVTFTADFEQGQKTYVLCGAYAFIGDNAIDLTYWTPPEDFDAFRPSFTAVIDSFRAN